MKKCNPLAPSTRRRGVGVVIATVMGLSSIALASPASTTTTGATAPAARRIAYQPTIGQQRTYMLQSRGQASVNMEALAAQMSPKGGDKAGKLESHLFEVSARVGTTVLAQENGEWLVAMSIENPRYVVDGTAQTDASRYQTAVLAHVSTRGEIKSIDFPAGFPDDAAVAIRALIEPMQVIFTDGAGAEWTVGEDGVNGAATVQYRLNTVNETAGVAHLSRTVKSARRALPGTTEARDRGRFQTVIKSSSGSIDWALDGSGPRAMSITESSESTSRGRVIATSETTFTARAENGASRATPTTLRDMRAALADTKFARESFYRVPGQFLNELEPVDFNTAKNTFVQRVNAAPSDMALLMKFYLRLHPEQAMDFAMELDKLAQGEETEALANVVGYGFAAMAAAGHKEAQQVLVNVISHDSWSGLSQRKALDAMLSLEMPERFVPSAVWAVREKLVKKGALLETISIATNIYGALGSVSLGERANTEEVVSNLARLLNSSDRWEQRRGLVALGNIGDPDLVLPHTERFFAARDEFLRLRAFDSFKNAEGERHFKRFAAHYAKETSLLVKRDASEVALSMGDSPARNAWAIDEARASDDLAIRSRAVTVLGRGLEDHPENADALRGLLDEVHDRETRRIIYSFVAPARRGAR